MPSRREAGKRWFLEEAGAEGRSRAEGDSRAEAGATIRRWWSIVQLRLLTSLAGEFAESTGVGEFVTVNRIIEISIFEVIGIREKSFMYLIFLVLKLQLD